MKEIAKRMRDFLFGEIKQSTGVDMNDIEGSTESLQQTVRNAMPPIDSLPPLRVDTTGNTRIRIRNPLPVQDN
jgi:hypothetical protein